MAMPRTIRLNETLEERITKYLKRNRMKFSQLVGLALEKFISEPQSVTYVPTDSKEFVDSAKEAFKKHKSQQRPAPHQGGVEALERLARMRGSEISVAAAEAYECMRFVA